MGTLEISKTWEHNGYKFIELAEGFYIFRKWDNGRIKTVKCNLSDLESGNIYKMIDTGFSRV